MSFVADHFFFGGSFTPRFVTALFLADFFLDIEVSLRVVVRALASIMPVG